MDGSSTKVESRSGAAAGSAMWGSDHIAEMMRALGLEYVCVTPGASFRGLHEYLHSWVFGNSRHPAHDRIFVHWILARCPNSTSAPLRSMTT